MTKEEQLELFEVGLRGDIAKCFMMARVSPKEHWAIIRGDREITVRDIAEIGYLTGFDINIKI